MKCKQCKSHFREFTSPLIDHILSHLLGSRVFKGCVPRDRIPKLNSPNIAYVLNLGSDQSPGTHWTAFYVTPSLRVQYFDPFGVQPPKEVTQAAVKLPVQFNRREVQPYNSTKCGAYAVYYLIQKVLNHRSIPSISDDFYSQPQHQWKNDALLLKWLHDHNIQRVVHHYHKYVETREEKNERKLRDRHQ